MSYIITDFCIGCGNCESGCPTSAITPTDSLYRIDPILCIDCAACSKICPVDAPKKDL
ncbi:4Fe-4S dicluster domain-containing protein [Clostridium collagenovorans DSM 3089]|uniref:4Fe-4S dicluster domain-containing protein n=1 Tax=Clostridium collagenovorans DSM 3089 TaxID=1121306 RepID=A0A1M5TIN9_9CLOT|nr:4Fe-4S binding protein [Clostridium collagenovorans]SHH50531.1 4Fe-4S dicluster domain-containing protein [Clostridium collagenovorans DSM 3089]